MATCPTCGADVPDGARFCQNCGAALTPTDQASGESLAEPRPLAAALPVPPAVPPYPITAYGQQPFVPQQFAPPPYALVPGQPPYALRKSGMALAGMICGIASLPLVFLSWIDIIIALCGIVFSLIGLKETNPRRVSPVPGAPPATGRTQAIVGLVLASIGLILASILLVYILANYNDLRARFQLR